MKKTKSIVCLVYLLLCACFIACFLSGCGPQREQEKKIEVYQDNTLLYSSTSPALINRFANIFTDQQQYEPAVVPPNTKVRYKYICYENEHQAEFAIYEAEPFICIRYKSLSVEFKVTDEIWKALNDPGALFEAYESV